MYCPRCCEFVINVTLVIEEVWGLDIPSIGKIIIFLSTHKPRWRMFAWNISWISFLSLLIWKEEMKNGNRYFSFIGMRLQVFFMKDKVFFHLDKGSVLPELPQIDFSRLVSLCSLFPFLGQFELIRVRWFLFFTLKFLTKTLAAAVQ